MSRERWVKVHQEQRLDLATSPQVPQWLRVMFLAEYRMSEDGHARFGRGELAKYLGTDNRTGECKPIDKHNVQRAIREAVRRGLILPDSGSQCLRLPQHRVTKGRGHRLSDCPHHMVGQTLTHQGAEGESDLDPQGGSNLSLIHI